METNKTELLQKLLTQFPDIPKQIIEEKLYNTLIFDKTNDKLLTVIADSLQKYTIQNSNTNKNKQEDLFDDDFILDDLDFGDQITIIESPKNTPLLFEKKKKKKHTQKNTIFQPEKKLVPIKNQITEDREKNKIREKKKKNTNTKKKKKKTKMDDKAKKRLLEKKKQYVRLQICFLIMFPQLDYKLILDILKDNRKLMFENEDKFIKNLTLVFFDNTKDIPAESRKIEKEKILNNFNLSKIMFNRKSFAFFVEQKYRMVDDYKSKGYSRYPTNLKHSKYFRFFEIILEIIQQENNKQEMGNQYNFYYSMNGFKNTNWFEVKDPVDDLYKKQAKTLLKYDFRKLTRKKIEKIYRDNGFRYAPTYKEIKTTGKNLFKRNKKLKKRKKKNINTVFFCERLRNEIEFILEKEKNGEFDSKKKKKKEKKEKKKKKGGQDVKNVVASQLDCMCCYTKVSIENMVSCKNGHLFCVDCLHNVVKHAIGQRRREIRCPGVEKCEFGFSLDMIKKAVPEKTWNLFERLVQEAEIREANIENLKKCPFCDFAVIIDNNENQTVFQCLNIQCKKKSCLLCGEEVHEGKTCQQYKKEKQKENKRHFIEEEMTKALLRECNNCGQKYYKTEGCNKIVCSNCGEIMCYLCQKSINKEKYNHFAKTGDKCRLWTSPKEDLRRIRSARRNARTTFKKLDENEKMQK
ncbi:e3 ubiquitin-protein ligase [Anaeramoeba flamelloides]|uniref:E3 ubiquitin-protein ligase n=1 Tax=Anaeramoeba flamelloides TaxID=1746091 RepID=A0ABQ8XUS9_9EUKA|nr:e3 ubiquitin-protein ligase [Anaeramoeba flamelloides]